jgi:hypothetical protein
MPVRLPRQLYLVQSVVYAAYFPERYGQELIALDILARRPTPPAKFVKHQVINGRQSGAFLSERRSYAAERRDGVTPAPTGQSGESVFRSGERLSDRRVRLAYRPPDRETWVCPRSPR